MASYTFLRKRFRVAIHAGASFNKLILLQLVDANDAVTGPYDLTDYDLFWCEAAAKEGATPVAAFTVSKTLVAGELSVITTAAQTAAIQAAGLRHGTIDIFGRANNEVVHIADGVFACDWATTDDFS